MSKVLEISNILDLWKSSMSFFNIILVFLSGQIFDQISTKFQYFKIGTKRPEHFRIKQRKKTLNILIDLFNFLFTNILLFWSPSNIIKKIIFHIFRVSLFSVLNHFFGFF